MGGIDSEQVQMMEMVTRLCKERTAACNALNDLGCYTYGNSLVEGIERLAKKQDEHIVKRTEAVARAEALRVALETERASHNETIRICADMGLPKPEPHDIAWAARMLREGKAVRKKRWGKGAHWILRDHDLVVFWSRNGQPEEKTRDCVSRADFDDDGSWELYVPEPAKPETFGWSEALRRMRAGKRVTRGLWGCSEYCASIAGNGTVVFEPSSTAFRFKVSDFDATDWTEVTT